jgi:hypothetical protein
MKSMILSQKFVTCPWGGWGLARQNVIDGIYNAKTSDISGRHSSNQDKKFVETIQIGDIVLIPFANSKECIICKIVSDVEYCIDTGLYWSEKGKQIKISENSNEGVSFKPVGRRIEIISECFIPNRKLGQLTLTKMNSEIVARLCNIIS